MPVQSIAPVTSARVAEYLGASGFSAFSTRNAPANLANQLSASPSRVANQSSLPISVTGVLFDARVSGLSGLGSRQSAVNATAVSLASGQSVFAR